MPFVTIIYGEEEKRIATKFGAAFGTAVLESGFPFEQPCAGKGTCGLCKVIIEKGITTPDEIEVKHLSDAELALNTRLGCRLKVLGDMTVILSPIVCYSNKIFRASDQYKKFRNKLGLAVDLGTTTVAAFLTDLNDLTVYAGGAVLNQQSVFGADVISRLAATRRDPGNQKRLHSLSASSIIHAIDSLLLSKSIMRRISRVTIVGNSVMHHLLANIPIDTLAIKPFQPLSRELIRNANNLLGGIFPDDVDVSLPPLIGGFVGSDALACLAYFEFNSSKNPIAAIDLGTNGEVMVTDGSRILAASTAAGPAFEGVFISCGTRAVDGAITSVNISNEHLGFEIIGDQQPIGLTGTGLLSLVSELRSINVIEPNGRINPVPNFFKDSIDRDYHGSRKINLTEDGRIYLNQWDIRELQKAKAAIRAAIDILLNQLGLQPHDLEKIFLTGSFGGQIDVNASLQIGMLPPVSQEIVHPVANGAGLGAAMFLSDEGLDLAVSLANNTQHIDLDADPSFIERYIHSMALTT